MYDVLRHSHSSPLLSIVLPVAVFEATRCAEQVNFFSAAAACQAVLPQMIEQRAGALVVRECASRCHTRIASNLVVRIVPMQYGISASMANDRSIHDKFVFSLHRTQIAMRFR